MHAYLSDEVCLKDSRKRFLPRVPTVFQEKRIAHHRYSGRKWPPYNLPTAQFFSLPKNVTMTSSVLSLSLCMLLSAMHTTVILSTGKINFELVDHVCIA